MSEVLKWEPKGLKEGWQREMSLRALNFCPPRFKTQEDGFLFMECMRDKKPFPAEKWIPVYRLDEQGNSVETEEYKAAPFQVNYI